MVRVNDGGSYLGHGKLLKRVQGLCKDDKAQGFTGQVDSFLSKGRLTQNGNLSNNARNTGSNSAEHF